MNFFPNLISGVLFAVALDMAPCCGPDERKKQVEVNNILDKMNIFCYKWSFFFFFCLTEPGQQNILGIFLQVRVKEAQHFW